MQASEEITACGEKQQMPTSFIDPNLAPLEKYHNATHTSPTPPKTPEAPSLHAKPAKNHKTSLTTHTSTLQLNSLGPKRSRGTQGINPKATRRGLEPAHQAIPHGHKHKRKQGHQLKRP
ncbi:hypothetical protein U1Q18_020286 [Sarracenia purpurea var. burkii]